MTGPKAAIATMARLEEQVRRLVEQRAAYEDLLREGIEHVEASVNMAYESGLSAPGEEAWIRRVKMAITKAQL